MAYIVFPSVGEILGFSKFSTSLSMEVAAMVGGGG